MAVRVGNGTVNLATAGKGFPEAMAAGTFFYQWMTSERSETRWDKGGRPTGREAIPSQWQNSRGFDPEITCRMYFKVNPRRLALM